MKKILIALAVLLAVQVADAQVKSVDAAKKAVETAEADSQNPKKNAKVATWLKLATTYMDAYEAPAGNVLVNSPRVQVQMMLGNERPSASEVVTVDGINFKKEVYSNKNLYFDETDVLRIIEITKPVYEDALARALNAYVKAYEVDTKKSKLNDIKAGIQKVAEKYFNDGMNQYSIGDLKKAAALVAKSAAAAETAPNSVVDTTALYNAGFIYWAASDFESAKTYFEKCLANNYYYENGETYAKLGDVYFKLGDNAKGVQTLETGFVKFPQSQSILIGLINYYMTKSENPNRLFELITLAKKNEPNNPSLPYVEGNIFVELRKADPENAETYVAKACEAYDACAAVDPNYEYGYIGKGIMYYNIAIELQEAAAAELDDAKWVQLNKQFTVALKNALEPFEKAYNTSKDESLKVNIAEYLKNIYYRFSSDGPEWEEGYNKYNEVVKTGKAL